MDGQTKYDDNLIFFLWDILKKYWFWYVLSTLFCCGLAALYIKTTPKSYIRTAAVLVKEDAPMNDVQAAFSNTNTRYGINVNDEIEAFKAPYLLHEVIVRLNLTTGYFKTDGLRRHDLYAKSPVKVLFLDADHYDAFSFHLEAFSDSLLMLSNFMQNKVKYETDLEVKLYDTISTPLGRMMITPTLFYENNSLGTIQIVKYNSMSLLGSYKGNISVSLSNKQSNIILLNFEDVSVQRADDVLNAIIDVYNENWLDEKNKAAIIAKEFFDERIPVIENELRDIENQLERYKSTHLLTDVRAAASQHTRESAEYTGKIVGVRNQIAVARQFLDHIRNNTNSNELLSAANIGLTNASIESQISLYNERMRKRNELIVSSGERNLVLVEHNTALEAMKKNIVLSIDNYLTGLQLELTGLQAQESKVTQNIASNPEQEKILISIERDYRIKQDLYLHLAQKREENDMALVVSTINTRVISPPYGFANHVKPQKNIILLIALIFGLSIPSGLLFFIEFLNTTIRSKNELDDLPAPLLGVIPKAGNRDKNKMLLVHEHREGAVNEGFRFLRTRLVEACAQDMKVIQITSMESGSGKTFVALNLAMSFALAGKKVALLDLDLRKATLSRLIGSPEFGIFHLLTKMVLHERYFIEKNYFYNGFDILPTGPLPISPSELLMNDSLEKLIQRFKTVYDYIFIDCPPADLVTDADIIAQYADFSVFVIRENYTNRRKLKDIRNMYQEKRFSNMRLILNDSIDEDHLDKYYSGYNKNIRVLPKATSPDVVRKSGYLT